MRIQALPVGLGTLLPAARPQYLGAGVAPVLVGSALGYATTRGFNPGLFILAVLAIGVVGVLGVYVYKAWPVRLGCCGVGEVVIGFLFGILPVFGSYYLQARSVDTLPLLPSLIVAILIFLVILINEFPDLPADRQANKRTMIVVFGVPAAIAVYRITLAASYVIAALMLARQPTFFGGTFYLLTLPLAIFAMRCANRQDLAKPGLCRANQLTILLHNVGSLALAVGLLIPGLVG